MTGVRLRTILLIVLIVAILTFILQNWMTVSLKIITWDISIPLGVLTLVVYVLGMLTGWAVFSFVGRSIRSVSETRRD